MLFEATFLRLFKQSIVSYSSELKRMTKSFRLQKLYFNLIYSYYFLESLISSILILYHLLFEF